MRNLDPKESAGGRKISYRVIKPVELLYKSLEDVKRELGEKGAQISYQELEKERQEKLDTCRRIRNELLMQGYPYVGSSSSLRHHLGNKNSPCSTPVAGIRSSPEASEAGSHGDFRSRKHDSVFTSKSSANKSDLPTPNTLEGNGKLIKAKDPIRSPLVIESEVIPMGNIDVEDSSRFIEQAPVVHLSPLPSLTKSKVNSSLSEGRKVKSVDQATFASKTSSRRSGRHRSRSLPLRPDTPKGTSSNLKSDMNATRTGSAMGNQGRKSSLGILDLGRNQSSRNSESPGYCETPLMDRKQESHVSFGDVNNNHIKAPIIMRPLSSRRKKHLERSKLLECKKVFDHIIAQYKDPEYCLMKYKQIIDNSIERELREQEVKKVQRRMEEGFEMWQDKVLMLQWLDSERAEEQVTRNLSTKIEKIRKQQKNKEILHSLNLNKVKEDDDIRAEILRRELSKKERKILTLQKEKERVILESKSRALAVSELKEQIRNIMTPETFDQKVNKCGREKKVIRVLHPPAWCPAIMQQSHISLG